jgi:hypothetical protein
MDARGGLVTRLPKPGAAQGIGTELVGRYCLMGPRIGERLNDMRRLVVTHLVFGV